MTNCLDLDVGNSRIKWRCGKATGVVDTHELPDVTPAVARVRISSVAQKEEALSDAVQRKYGVTPEFAHCTRQLGRVMNGYRDVTMLGVDRWLAIVAAWNQTRSACLVIDAGTALTADFVFHSGLHHGGYIVPGIASLHDVLGARTANVQVESEDFKWWDLSPAKDTVGAVRHGTVLMAAQWINHCCELAEQTLGKPLALLLTGGDGEFLQPLLRSGFELRPHLVLDGLAIALP